MASETATERHPRCSQQRSLHEVKASQFFTADGYEIQFGTNHVSHALLIKFLLSTLASTTSLPGVTDVRIASTTSVGFRFSHRRGINFSAIRTNSEVGFGARYVRNALSKLANPASSAALAERYPALTCVAVHPGVIKTEPVTSLGFWHRMLITSNLTTMLSAEHGIKSPLLAATAKKEEVESGKYDEPVGVLGALTKDAKVEQLRIELWEWTQKGLEAYPT